MKNAFWFLIALFIIAVAIFALKSPTISISTGNVALKSEANLTTESLYFYTLLLGTCVLVCFVIWYFNHLFERQEKARVKVR